MAFTTNASERMRIDNTGNVGIGTTSPAVKLHVGAATLGVAPDTNADVISSGGITIDNNKRLSFDTAYYVHGNIKYNTSGTAATEAKLEYQGYYGHNFITRSSSKMVIQGNTGNVGIGTTSPGTKLTISASNSGAVNNNTLRFVDTDVTTQTNQSFGKIEFETKDTNNPGVNAFINAFAEGTGGTGALSFGTGSGGSTERMRIASSGNVGIGTT
jgi:hypothetical protein